MQHQGGREPPVVHPLAAEGWLDFKHPLRTWSIGEMEISHSFLYKMTLKVKRIFAFKYVA